MKRILFLAFAGLALLQVIYGMGGGDCGGTQMVFAWDYSSKEEITWVGEGKTFSDYTATAFSAAPIEEEVNLFYSSDSFTSNGRTYEIWKCDSILYSGVCKHWIGLNLVSIGHIHLTRTCGEWSGVFCTKWVGSELSSTALACREWNCVSWNAEKKACSEWKCMETTVEGYAYEGYKCTLFENHRCRKWSALGKIHSEYRSYSSWRCSGCTKFNKIPSAPFLNEGIEGKEFDERVLVSWEKSIDAETPSENLSYLIEYFDEREWKPAGKTGKNETIFLWNTSFLKNGNYSIRVKAFDEIDYGSPSNQVNISIMHFNYSLELMQETPAIDSKNVLFKYQVIGNKSGVCRIPVFKEMSEQKLFDYLNNSINFFIENEEARFNCSFCENNYSFYFQTPSPQFSQWIQEEESKSSLFKQFIYRIVSNNLSIVFSKIDLGVPEDFECTPRKEEFVVESKKSSLIKCFGNGVNSIFEEWREDEEKKSRAGGTSFISKKVFVENKISVLLKLEIEEERREGWTCTSLKEVVLLPFEKKVLKTGNCSKNNSVNLIEGNWVMDESRENTLSNQWIKKSVFINNSDEISYERLEVSIGLPEGNLTQLIGETICETRLSSFENKSLEFFVQTDFIKEEVTRVESNEFINYSLKAIPSNNFSLKNIVAFLDFEKSLFNAFIEENGVYLSFETNCPQMIEEKNTGIRGCRKAIGEKTSGFVIVIPEISFKEIRFGGRKPFPEGSSCSSSFECDSGRCYLGKCGFPKEEQVSTGFKTIQQNPLQSLYRMEENSLKNHSIENKELFEKIDLRVRNHSGIGFLEIIVFSEGKPANGTLEIIDPNGRRYYRNLDSNGGTKFFFDKKGTWFIRFKNESKEIKIIEEKKEQNVVEVKLNAMAFERNGVSSTGMAVSSINYFAVIPLAFAAIILVYWRCFSKKMLARKFENGLVTIEVRARKDLKEVEVREFIEEEASASNFSETPFEEKEAITGVLLRFKKSFLKKGEVWRINYSLSGGGNAKTRLSSFGKTLEFIG